MLKPSWSWRDGLIRLNYELPHRIHATKIYPIRAPNGSSIILYGHEHGLTIMWRGGKPFKNKRKLHVTSQNVSEKNDRVIDDSIMIIDSDNDEQVNLASKSDTTTDQDEFDSEEEEYDPSEPYDRILEVLDVPNLRTAVLHLGIPSISSKDQKNAIDPMPTLFGTDIVVAAACADSSVRLFTIPLTPRQHQRRSAREPRVRQRIIVESSQKSTLRSRSVDMTWTRQESAASSPGRDENMAWTLLIASHTAQAGGLLSVFQQPLHHDGTKLSDEPSEILRTEHIHSPASTIAFSPSRYPTHRHTQLLLVDTKGAIRIYDPLPRRRSQSIIRSYESRQQTSPQHGTWLASIYPPFEGERQGLAGPVAQSGRSRILDAQWAFDGDCVITLLADGQWGLWDIEGIGPTTTKAKSYGDGGSSGPSAGSITRFALRGFIGDGATSIASKLPLEESTTRGHTARESIRLAPMTPNTRKVKQQKLFSGPTTSSSSIPTFVRGAISLSIMPSTSTSQVSDENLVLWYENAVFVIPSLMAYWQRVAGTGVKTQDSGTLYGPSIAQLSALSAQGELITGIAQTPHQIDRTLSTKLPHDVLMAAEHRLVMLCHEKSREQPVASVVSKDLAATETDDEGMMRLDEEMLSKRQLDLGGLDRMLDSMTGRSTNGVNGGLFGSGSNPLGLAAGGRKVGFAAGF